MGRGGVNFFAVMFIVFLAVRFVLFRFALCTAGTDLPMLLIFQIFRLGRNCPNPLNGPLYRALC